MYYIAFAIWYLCSLLPLWVHYRVSDVLYVLIYYVAGYRTKVVRKNLSTSFSEKTPEELRKIERGFYRWFCDYMVETVKLFSIKEKTMRRRMKFEGVEQAVEDCRNGRHVSFFVGHYCNWEWFSSMALYFPTDIMRSQLYHPIENKVMDRLFLYSRGRFGVLSINMMDAFKLLARWTKQGKVTATGYVADQVPGYSSMHYWPWFLNHDTPAYTGAERISRILDASCYYLDVYRPRRGYYVVKFVKMCDHPSEVPKFGLTEKYYRLLETSIKRNPEYWLWSHNRWKRTREQFNAEYPEEERQRILSKL